MSRRLVVVVGGLVAAAVNAGRYFRVLTILAERAIKLSG
jgi:hypothetical protein